MIFRARRDGGSQRFLELRAALLLVGSALGLAGMLYDRAWMVFTGIAVLAVGIVIRLINRRGEEGEG